MMYPQVFKYRYKTISDLNKKLEEIVGWNPQFNVILNVQYPSKNIAMILARVSAERGE